MEIFINGRFLTQKLSGVQQFAREICKELLLVKNITILVPARDDLTDNSFNNHILRIGNFKGHLWEQVDLPVFINKQKGAVLLNLCNTGPLMVSNQVATLHDLAFIINPSWFSKSFSTVYHFLIPLLVKKSKHLLTVSETVKQEIASQFNYDQEKISVVSNKVSEDLLNAEPIPVKHEDIKPGSYFLMVGSRNPRKNFDFAENVFSKYLTRHVLVIAGASHRAFNKTALSFSSNTIHLESIDNGELKWLYENSKAVINPSLYEGFGIPNLETFAFKKPLLCSDIPVFKEICGNAAMYFNPEDESSLLSIIKKVINHGLTEENVDRGHEIFQSYQQKQRAVQIINILEK